MEMMSCGQNSDSNIWCQSYGYLTITFTHLVSCRKMTNRSRKYCHLQQLWPSSDIVLKTSSTFNFSHFSLCFVISQLRSLRLSRGCVCWCYAGTLVGECWPRYQRSTWTILSHNVTLVYLSLDYDTWVSSRCIKCISSINAKLQLWHRIFYCISK